MLVLSQQLALPSVTATKSAILKAFLGVVSDYDTCRYSQNDIRREFSSSRGAYTAILDNMDKFAEYLGSKDYDLSKTTATALKPDEDEDEDAPEVDDIVDVDDRPTSFEELRRSDFIKYLANEAYNYMNSADGPYRQLKQKDNVQSGMYDSESDEVKLYVDVKEDNSDFNAENEAAAKQSVILAVRQLCDMSIHRGCNLMDVIIFKAKKKADPSMKVDQEVFARSVRRWKPPTNDAPGTWIYFAEKTGFRNYAGFIEAYQYINGVQDYPAEIMSMMSTVEYVCNNMGIDLSKEDNTPYTKEGLPMELRTLIPGNREYCSNVLNAYKTMPLRGSSIVVQKSPLESIMTVVSLIAPRYVVYDKHYVSIQDRELFDLTDAIDLMKYLMGGVMEEYCGYTGGVFTICGNPITIPSIKLGVISDTQYVLFSSGLLVPMFPNNIIPVKFDIYDAIEILNAYKMDVGEQDRRAFIYNSKHSVI